MRNNNRYLLISGCLATLLVSRMGEYLLDFMYGDKNGYFSNPLLSSGVNILYSSCLIALVVLMTLNIRQWLHAHAIRLTGKIPGNFRRFFAKTTEFWIVLFYALQGYSAVWIARNMFGCKSETLSGMALALVIIGIGGFIILEVHNKKALVSYILIMCISGVMLYTTTCLINVLFYNYGYLLSFLSQTTRYRYWSFGVFDKTTNPRYRRQFHGFVPPADKIGTNEIGDIFKVYGLPLHPFEVSWPASDALGWPNSNPLDETGALFIGDSFGRAYGAGFAYGIPAQFEKQTGIKTYNASNEGYGLAHYHGILQYLVQDAPDNLPRFKGKLVYILLYAGNDFSLDLAAFQNRVAEERKASGLAARIAFHLKLTALRRLMALAYTLSQHDKSAAKKEFHQLVTPTDFSGIEQEKKRTQGWYPHFTTLSLYEGEPFAFFRGNLVWFRELEWLTEHHDAILNIFQEIATFSTAHHIQVRFVVLPTKLRILAPHLNPVPSNKELEFDRLFEKIVKNEQIVHEVIVSQLRSVGFEVLDMYPIFAEEIVRKPLLWPGDLHYSAAGYELVAKSIITEFH